jgi:hypothetical protein
VSFVTRWFARGISTALVLVSLVLLLSQFLDSRHEGKFTSFPFLSSLGFLIGSVGLAAWVRRRDFTPQFDPTVGGYGRDIYSVEALSESHGLHANQPKDIEGRD